MNQSVIPAPLTIDFRGDLHPSRSWILGITGGVLPSRVELLARTHRSAEATAANPLRPVGPQPSALVVECACPDFCERDHTNE